LFIANCGVIITNSFREYPVRPTSDEFRTAPSGCRPSNQANQLVLWVRL